MTRRRFLQCAAAAAVPLRWPQAARSAPVAVVREPVLLDLGAHCALRESLAGYAAAGSHLRVVDVAALRPSPLLIVPAAAGIPEPVVRTITSCCDAGGLVILESGAGFAGAADCSAHRAVLRDAFDIQSDPPVDLWPPSGGSAIPYVEFSWPGRATVRDFSRAVPLRSRAGVIIARVNGLPVGVRRRSGRGTLIVLGSPLGPALWAGDSEARQWLRAVTR